MLRCLPVLLMIVLISACAEEHDLVDARRATRVEAAWVIAALSLFGVLFPDLVAIQRQLADRTTIRVAAGAVLLLCSSALLDHHGLLDLTGYVQGLADNH